MNLFLQSTYHLIDTKSDQLRQLLRDLEHIKSLTKIRGNSKLINRTCTYCKIPHNLDGEHNLVISQYTEAQFIADLISEFDTLYQICNWAHESIGKQIIRDTMTPNEKAWNHILSGEYDQVNQYLNEEEKTILNSLKPLGWADKQFDFMQLSINCNENWVLTLEQLYNYVNRPVSEVNKLYSWAVCHSIDWQTGLITKFNENLWLNIRAELFYRVMSRHNDLYPKFRKCINFGLNKSFLWVPQKYELNCGYMNDEIDRIGKKFIILIINFLTTKDGLQGLVDIVQDAIQSIQTQTDDIKQAELRARCYYEIGLMLSDLLDLDSNNNIQFMELIKILVNLIKNEFIDHTCKQKYLIHLLSILSQNETLFEFIFQVCQDCIKSQGDSLSAFLQRMIEYNFQRPFITLVAFDQFSNLSPIQQIELLSPEFEYYFDQVNLNEYIQRLIPQIVENMENFNETFQRLFSKYYSILQDEEEYFRIFINKDIELMLRFLSQMDIPYYWFVKYITYILNQPNIEYIHIQRIMEGIEINHKLFYELEVNKEVLALIAKKLTQFQDFAHYLLN